MMDVSSLKRITYGTLIGSLIIAALVAVVAVLVGDFNEIMFKVLMTLFVAIVHSVLSLIFIWDNDRRNTFTRLSFFINTLFVLIVVSFITALFGIWEIFSTTLTSDLYQTYFILAFAALHGDILSKALGKEKYLDMIIYVNYVFMFFVVIMFQPIIYLDYDVLRDLGEFYYRLLAACGIVDGTLSILAIIFYKMYMAKHPEEESELVSKSKKGLSIWVWILIIYLVVQIIFPMLFWIGDMMFRYRF